MKKRYLFSVLIVTFSITSCIFKTDENDYKTPELFLEQVKNLGCNAKIRSSKYDYQIGDCDFLIYDELKTIKDYINISSINDKSDTYFYYEDWIPATSGPNIARMTVYDNGYLEIYRKESLGRGHYFYFSFDKDLATFLNRFVENQIELAISEESINNAQEVLLL